MKQASAGILDHRAIGSGTPKTAVVRKFVLSVQQMLETCARSGCKSIAGGLFWNVLWIGASAPPCRGAICSHPPAQAENLTQPKTESQ